MGRTFTAEEVAAIVVDANRLMVKKVEDLATQFTRADFQRALLAEFVEEVRRSGDTRLANMAIAVLAKAKKAADWGA
jgi:hypothetical protein